MFGTKIWIVIEIRGGQPIGLVLCGLFVPQQSDLGCDFVHGKMTYDVQHLKKKMYIEKKFDCRILGHKNIVTNINPLLIR